MKVIDYKETMKCLDEVEDCEDKTYAKSLLEWAINKRTFEAIPLSVIEDIKSVLELFSNEANQACEASNCYSIRDKLRTLAQAYDNVARLIDCKIAETTGDKECNKVGRLKIMNLLELKEIVDKEIEKGNGDAIIEVQAIADGIGDIIISGYEGCGHELGGDVKVFSLISDIEKKEMETS